MNCTTSPEFENNNIIQPNSAKVCLLYLKTLAALQTGKKRQNATSEKWLTPVSLLKRKISVSSLSKICAVQLIILAWQKTSNAFVEVHFKGLVLYQVAYATFYFLNDFLSLIELIRRCLVECLCCSFQYSDAEWRPQSFKLRKGKIKHHKSSPYDLVNDSILWENKLKFKIAASHMNASNVFTPT